MHVRSAFALPFLALALCGCGAAPAADPDAPAAPPPPQPRGEYEGTGTVLQSAGRGPELCLGAVAESYPPQCSGIPLDNWDWDAVTGEERAAGTTWGDYDVVGTFDGKRFAADLARVRPAARAVPPRPDPFGTPCEEPPGGWVAHDASRLSDEALDAAAQEARSAPDFSGLWVDYLRKPVSEADARADNLILNVAFTGDPAEHEEALREHWGGPLCVVRYARTYAELERIQEEVTQPDTLEELGLELLSAHASETENVVHLDVVVAPPEATDALAERYGDGTVVLHPALVPVVY